jgi:methylglutaconyl-CoA hydratase
MTALTIRYDGPRATITLTQPEIRNAFSDEVIAEITAAFTEVGARADVRAVVLAAEGPAFCAGANLNWMRRMADYTREQNLADAAKLAEMLRVIYECPKPTIARVQGDVYAGGTGLVAACDMAAHRYFLTAERFGAQEALRIGFVHEVVTAEQLDAKVDELVKALISASPNAVRACKKLVLDVAEREINAALIAATVEGIADIRASDEGREGVQSFLQKRKPSWLA